jgi:hypothetical protein
MKKKPLIFSAMSAITVMGILLGVACKKENQVQEGRPVVAGTLAACECAVPVGDSVIQAGAINVDLTLSNAKAYTLNGLVFITGNRTLTIQAGALIKGAVGSGTIGGTPGGGLIITKGSKLNAVGTSTCPIVFTSAGAVPKSGDWGGIVLLGYAPTNADSTTVTVEGINTATAPAGVDVRFGGNRPLDNSGNIQFVRIEYAGYALSLNNEMNGLTMAGVGSGTTIDYVEVYKSNDDSFEWFGGTVNASHLLSIDGLDDMFDTDNGYTGTISFALGLADTLRADQSESNGFESDNDKNGSTRMPYTHPVYKNVTVVGVPATRYKTQYTLPGGLIGKYGRAAHLRRNAEFEINNSIFLGFKYGISQDIALPGTGANTFTKYGTISTTANVYVHAYDTTLLKENGAALTTWSWLGTGNNDYLAYATLGYFVSGSPLVPNPFDRSSINNFIPSLGKPARAYGAFPNGANWTVVNGCSNWVRLQ